MICRRLVGLMATIFAVGMSVPAQAGLTQITGEWWGFDNYTEMIYNIDGSETTYSYKGWTFLDLTFEVDQYDDVVEVTTSLGTGYTMTWSASGTFGPQSANFTAYGFAGGPGGFTYDMNFFATYDGISPDGTIIDGGPGSAVADATYDGVNYYDGSYFNIFESFQSALPEPPSFVLMAMSILVLAPISCLVGRRGEALRARCSFRWPLKAH